MIRPRHLPWLALVLFGALAVLSLQACGPRSHGDDLTEEIDKSVPLERPAREARLEKPRVTLYETSWCGYCRKTRSLLDSLDVRYVAKDVEKSPAAAREFEAKTGGYNGVPVVDVDGRIVKGYRPDEIRKLVNRLKAES